MRNDELFSPRCPDEHAKRLVLNYALRNVLDGNRCYSEETLIAAQYMVYKEWLAEVRKSNTGFSCCFHEWLSREEDTAFIFKPGDLVEYKGRYCVVTGRIDLGVGWTTRWRIVDGTPMNAAWPQQMTTLNIKGADGRVRCVHGLDDDLKPADIPPEVFALACGRAKDCPMLKGGSDGE